MTHTSKGIPMTRTTRALLAAGLALAMCGGGHLLAACGGGQKTSKEGMSRLAADAPPPPSGGGGEIQRDVSREAKNDFAEAVKYYQDQAKDGWNRGECNAAAERFVGVASAHDKLIEARFNAGLSYQNCGILKEAEAQYQAALKINAAHGPSLANLGQIYFLGGNEARAKEYWEKALAADLKTAAAHNNLAWLMIRDVRAGKANLRDVEPDALGHLQRTLAVENDNVEAYVLLALLHMEGSEKNKSRLTLSKFELDKGKEIDAKFPALHNAYGLLALKQDQVAEALGHFQRAVELDGSFVEARMNVGNVVLGFRKYDEAASQFDAVLKLAPKNYDAMIGLGIAKRGQRDLDGAEAAYAKAAQLDGSRPEAPFNLGVLYKDFRANQTQDLKGAQKFYEQAIAHFRNATSKSKVSGSLQSDARDNIEDCQKNIQSLNQAIQSQASQPKPTSAAPIAPAAPSTPAGT
jgi:tetratricopeptide (TPR) repeat protein